jgi:TolB protein
MMKLVLLERKIQAYYLCGGLLAFAVCFLLVSTSIAQNADTSIVFMSQRSGVAEIYRMNPDGKQIRQLTEEPQYANQPAWSPDGQQITFMALRGPLWRGEIYVMNADGTNPINLTQSLDRPDSKPSWSPDGKQIVFTAAPFFNWDIWVMAAGGGRPRKLTNRQALHHGQNADPDWSPDGKQIVFSSDRNGNFDIYVMEADGTNPVNLTNHLAIDLDPDWSPDGKQIAFTSDRDENVDIYVMDADGANPIRLTNAAAKDRRPAWSPDGTQIAFTSLRDGNGEIYVMNADGTNPINLTQHREWDTNPSWGSVPTLSVSPNKKLAILWGEVKRAR